MADEHDDGAVEPAPDPIEYLTQHASHAVDTTKILGNIVKAARSGQLTVGDAAALGAMLETRSMASAMLFEALKRDARLPEGVRVILAELAVAEQAIAAVLQWQIKS